MRIPTRDTPHDTRQRTIADPPPAPYSGMTARVMQAVAILACGPYLAIKVAWIAGSHIGIPAGSVLLDHRAAMIVGNLASVLLDSAVVVLALLFTRRWGRRVPPWLLAVPVWAATGLLSPIVLGYPLQLLARLLGGDTTPAGGDPGRPFLHEWVFTVVYAGFIVQALALGVLFVIYARSRWGHLWQGRISVTLGHGPTSRAQRDTALMTSAILLVPLAIHILWAAGSTTGLTAVRIADRTSDYYALEAAYAVFAALAVGGLLLMAFPRSGLALRVPLSLTFVGSAALACRGAYTMFIGLVSDDPSGVLSESMNLVYAMQVCAGLLVVAMWAYFFAERGMPAVRPNAPSD